MAKRQREEAEAIAELSDTSNKKQKVKKDKKEKKENKDKTVVEDAGQDVAETLSKEERKALKRAKKEQAKVAVEDVAANGQDDEAAAKAEKKARKEAKKAAKLANGGAAEDKTGNAIPVKATTTTTAKSLSKSEAEAYFADKQIGVQDSQSSDLSPIVSFDSLPFDDATKKAYFSDFKEPSPIQAASWPYLIAGRDLIGVAETGSGKTFAFGVPCINRLQKGGKQIQVCIVSPTRELALQIQEQMTKLTRPRGLKATCIYGGVNKDEQRQLIKGSSIIVATPGRLNDFIQEGSIDLSNVNYLVLDEADRMLDTGFEQDIRKIILSTAPSAERQTLMFTATWPPSVRELASEFLRDPVRITIGDNASGELRANMRIVQEVEVMDEFAKQARMLEVLKQYQSGKNKSDRILVFCLYKKEATRVEETIRRRGFKVAGIHGDLSQEKRTQSLAAFKSGEVPLLVATDVAARGLDIPAVKLVLNVTFPLTVEDYVHRIGR
jgi:ATP-dependent RNA helicase DBP3